MDKNSFINFCMAMQCERISHIDVITVIKELSYVADANGYDKRFLLKMLEELEK